MCGTLFLSQGHTDGKMESHRDIRMRENEGTGETDPDPGLSQLLVALGDLLDSIVGKREVALLCLPRALAGGHSLGLGMSSGIFHRGGRLMATSKNHTRSPTRNEAPTTKACCRHLRFHHRLNKLLDYRTAEIPIQLGEATGQLLAQKTASSWVRKTSSKR